MHSNLLCIPTLVLAVIAYLLGYRWYERIRLPKERAVVLGIGILFAVPGLLFTAYYAHFFDHAQWFFELRTLPYSELSAAGAGIFAGMLANGVRRSTSSSFLARSGVLILLLLWLAIPYLKPIFRPMHPAQFMDQWLHGVCLQSTGSSCGPASAVTLATIAGCRCTERDLAVDSYTSTSSTESWYLVRALRKRGLNVRYAFRSPNPMALPYPAIAGTCLGGPHGPGHFIAIIGETPTDYIIGDPLIGKVLLAKANRDPRYYFTGFFILVSHRP